MLPLIGKLSPKLKLFANGRINVFSELQKNIKTSDKVIWFHCASLGEYEQGLPVLEALKNRFINHKIVITFFSPSGYEVKKNKSIADCVVYLPIDTPANTKRFVALAQPELAVFVKYEFWHNYLQTLKSNTIPCIVISAAFRKDQAFFKWYGGFMRNTLQSVTYFFVQDKISKTLLNEIGLSNVTISGDIRFDRVAHQIEMDNYVDFITDFVDDRLCIVIGSSWAEDEAVFINFINNSTDEICFIIAPHEIKENNVIALQNSISKKTVLFSEKENKNLKNYPVLIMNTIGYLSRIYSYADIAYVGGAMGNTGLHNILEPATFGIPIIIGQNFNKFQEAKQLQKLAGLFSVSTSSECSAIMNKLVQNEKFREQTGMISGHYINSNTGATATIVEYLNQLLDD